MALINKIRQKSGWAVGIVAIALGLFVVGGDILGPSSVILGKNKTDVGEIAGEVIEREAYQYEIDMMKNNYMVNRGTNPSEAEMFTIRQQAWEYLIVKTAFQKQYDALGIKVTDDEEWDMIQGKNVVPELKQIATDPQTGEFKREYIVNMLADIGKLPPQQQYSWMMFQENLRPSRLRVKHESLLTKTIYATEAEARKQYNAENSIAEIKYLYIPFYTLSDSVVEVSDSELESYISKNEETFQQDASRDFDYVSIPVVPSSEDSVFFYEEMDKIKADFKASTEDSVFARNNSDGLEYFFRQSVKDLPKNLQNNYSNLTAGDVRGPYFIDGLFTFFKITDIIEDTTDFVKASHILIKWKDESDAEKAAAKKKAQDLLNQLRAGADFAELARQNSADNSNAGKGGDLGWFGKGMMVKPFEEAAFGKKDVGLVNKIVETQFGYHLIKVTEPVNNKTYLVASVEREMIPSEATKDKAFKKADFFASESKNYNQFTENANQDSTLNILRAERIGKNARNFNQIQNSRRVIQWIYDEETKVGDVSEVIELDDQYIIASLTKVREEGTASVDDVRSIVTSIVKNQKKGDYIINKLNGLKGKTLEEISKEYGNDAEILTSSNLKLTDNSLPTVGTAFESIGRAFSLKEGEISEPIKEEMGIIIIKLEGLTPATEIADYAASKNKIEQRNYSIVSQGISEAIKDDADIKDYRYRFY